MTKFETAEALLRYLVMVHADSTADVIGEMYAEAERHGIRTSECRECERTIVYGSKAPLREVCAECAPDA